MNILNKLTIKHLTMNKKRTIVTIIGIILSTALMVGIGCIVSSFRDNARKEVILNSGSQHVSISSIPQDKFSYIKNNVQVEQASLEYPLGYSKLEESQNEYKPYLYVQATNKDYFSFLTLVKGRFPKNDQEIVIPEHLSTNGKVTYQIGDQIEVSLSNRISIEFDDVLDQRVSLQDGETLVFKEKRTYTIVGIVKRPIQEPHSAPGYTVTTLLDEAKMDGVTNVKSSIVFKNIKDTQKKTSTILKQMGFSPSGTIDGVDFFENVDYNEGLLAFSGHSSFTSVNDVLIRLLAIMLSLVSIGCVIVIYNSFAISVMERKKQFGLFSSVGATARQLRKTVFFEAFLVGIIGIPLGFFAGVFGIYVVLEITNYLLPNLFSSPLELSLYPLFIIIPILFMIITILVSAFIPARKASKISPIEAIRLNDDIKVNSKKIKTSKLSQKLFGVEGELAIKNMKRNKKKYRITILSLFISIVLFLSFSAFLSYGTRGSSMFFNTVDYDVQVYIYGSLDDYKEDIFAKLKQISSLDKVEDFVTSYRNNQFYISKTNMKWTKEFDQYLSRFEEDYQYPIEFVVLDDMSYKNYVESIGFSFASYDTSEVKPILLNKKIERDYETQKTKEYAFTNTDHITMDLLVVDQLIYSAEGGEVISRPVEMDPITVSVSKTDVMPKFVSVNDGCISMIISNKMLDTLLKAVPLSSDELEGAGPVHSSYQLYMKSKEHAKLTEEIEDIASENNLPYYLNVNDVTASMQMEKNLVFVIGMFLYGFISLVTLIGVTSVFNTINTSIALRRKEFAVLRSIGLTPHGMNKMLAYESILYGLKALLYALPVSFAVMYLIHLSMNDLMSFGFSVPWREVIIAIVMVFVITFLTMIYASSKIKKENILDAIREENI